MTKKPITLSVLDFSGKSSIYDSLSEKAMAPHSSTLAWKIPWMEEPGRLQSMGSLRVGHEWATSLSLFTLCIGEGNGNPLRCSCLDSLGDEGAWWTAIYVVTQSWKQLKWLSSIISIQISENIDSETRTITEDKGNINPPGTHYNSKFLCSE